MKRLLLAAVITLAVTGGILLGKQDEPIKEETPDSSMKEPAVLPETTGEPRTLADFKKINPRISYVLTFEDDDIERIIPVVATADFDSVFRKNIYGEEDSMGSVFCDEGPYEPVNLVVFGHASRTRDCCFTFLKKLKDKDYYDSHPYFRMESENGLYRCRIASFARYDLENEETYLGWAEPALSNIREMFAATVPYLLESTQGVTDTGSGLITLVTCDLDMQDGRYVVQAVREEYEG